MEILAPTEERINISIITSKDAKLGTKRSIPINAICVLGMELAIRPLPSLDTIVIVPVSATPKLQPVKPTSARKKRSRI